MSVINCFINISFDNYNVSSQVLLYLDDDLDDVERDKIYAF